MNFSLAEIYGAGRRELAEDLMGVIGRDRLAQKALWLTLWSWGICDSRQQPQRIFPFDDWRYRIEAAGFGDRPLGIERQGGWLRLQTNTEFYLPVREYKDFQAFHDALSKKLRRKLRGLEDAYLEEQVQFAPLRTAADMEEFMEIFRTQWPDDPWMNELRPYLPKIYLRLEETGRNRSFMLRDRDGKGVAALMAYQTDRAVNWHLLSRRIGMLDKLAPGVFMIFRALKHFFTETGEQFMVYGPGDYDWKRRFLGRTFPVYRYEKIHPFNLIGLAGLWKKERELRSRQQAAAGAEDE